MSGNPGNSLRALLPTPPERGSFPLDHDKDCFEVMNKYLKCMKLVANENAPNCRLLAKEYLRCRMENGLMKNDDWANLGLPPDQINLNQGQKMTNEYKNSTESKKP